jgi:hypothetical protein
MQDEGNDVMVNWSLVEDGVVASSGDAYRNARLGLLTSNLPGKVTDGKMSISSDTMYALPAAPAKEAGDSIGFNEFAAVFEAAQGSLSEGGSIFVEDAGLGAHTESRVGVRIITNSATAAMAARALLVPVPVRAVDHRARFRGWNLDPRWQGPQMEWNGSYYEDASSSVPARGQREVCVYVGGGSGGQCAVQYVQAPAAGEEDGPIVGANVVVSEDASVLAMVDAAGAAASVLLNEHSTDSLALPSILLQAADGSTQLVVGDVSATQPIAEAALAKGVLLGAYHNALSPGGVSALWAGVVAASSPAGRAPTGTWGADIPQMVSAGKAALALGPDNLVPSPKQIVFLADKAEKLTVDGAVERAVALSDESKAGAAKALFSGADLKTAKSIKV